VKRHPPAVSGPGRAELIGWVTDRPATPRGRPREPGAEPAVERAGEAACRCRDCGRAWTASREAHCPGCHRQFSSDSAFDAHLVLDHGPCTTHPGNRRPHRVCCARSICRDPATLRSRDGTPRLMLTRSRFGPVWAWPSAPPGDGAGTRWPQRQEARAAAAPDPNPGGATAAFLALRPRPGPRPAAGPGGGAGQ
jgi:hypothetical protein